ncbi:Uncharacterised protein [Mycobacteroides abscessus subsp. abscessus]|nr:Uncharacterised protein [Mycobacteroides abscessus subsp. abscessus]
MRSSCEASETNCRIRFSERVWPSNESSIRPSMVLSAAESRPSSVLRGKVGTRWLRSPPAIRDAVFSMSRSGRKVLLIAQYPMPATIASASRPMPIIVFRARSLMLSISRSKGTAIVTST